MQEISKREPHIFLSYSQKMDEEFRHLVEYPNFPHYEVFWDNPAEGGVDWRIKIERVLLDRLDQYCSLLIIQGEAGKGKTAMTMNWIEKEGRAIGPYHYHSMYDEEVDDSSFIRTGFVEMDVVRFEREEVIQANTNIHHNQTYSSYDELERLIRTIQNYMGNGEVPVSEWEWDDVWGNTIDNQLEDLMRHPVIRRLRGIRQLAEIYEDYILMGNKDGAEDSLVETHNIEDSAKPFRGLHPKGALAGTLSSRWSLYELILRGTGGISALHRALRIQFISENTDTIDSDPSTMNIQKIEQVVSVMSFARHLQAYLKYRIRYYSKTFLGNAVGSRLYQYLAEILAKTKNKIQHLESRMEEQLVQIVHPTPLSQGRSSHPFIGTFLDGTYKGKGLNYA